MEDADKFDRMTDLRILQTIMAEVDSGGAPEPILEAADDFRRLLYLCETEVYQGELWEFLKYHPRLARLSALPTARRILGVIRHEVEKLAAAKAHRTLTEEEKTRLHDELLPLLRKVDSLVGQAAGGKGVLPPP